MNKKIFNTAFTMGATHVNRLYLQRIAFTMAEILLSLTIIGVVAAITLPSLTGNINERTWNTQRKALYARMSQAIPLIGSLNGYGIGATESQTASNAAKAFITNGLAKVYKINNICDADHLQDCGFPSEIGVYSPTDSVRKILTPKKLTELNTLFNYSSTTGTNHYSQIDTATVAFETGNGESILAFYNPLCSYIGIKNDSAYSYLQPMMCVNFIYDLNGPKGPNSVGRDIGIMTVFYPTDSIVAAPIPLPLISVQRTSANPNFSIGLANSECRKKYGDDARVPNIEELMAIFVNKNLKFDILNQGHISSTISTYPYVHSVKMQSGQLDITDSTTWYNDNIANSRNTVCVK